MNNEVIKLKSQPLHPKQLEFAKKIDECNLKQIMLNLGRNFGKTTLMNNLIIKTALTNDDTVIYLITQTQTFTKTILEQIHSILKPFVTTYNKGELIKLQNGTVIQGFSYNNFENLRGNNFAKFVFIDEAAKIPDVAQESVISQICLTVKRVFLISTPRGKNQYYKKFRNTNASHMLYLHGTSYDNPFISEDAKEELRKLKGNRIYEQEVEARFIESGGGVFNDVTSLQSRIPLKQSKTYYTGIDLAKEEDYTVLTTLNEDLTIVDIERFNKTESYEEIVNRIVRHQKKQNSHLCVETNNFGAIIIEQLFKRGIKSIKEFTTTNTSKNEIITSLIFKLGQGQITTAIDVPELINELEQYDYMITKNGNISYSAPQGLHDDCVMSLAFANHLFEFRNTGNIKKVVSFSK